MKRLFLVVALALVLVAPSLAQATNLVANGDFAGGPTIVDSFTTLFPGSTAIPDWTVGPTGSIDYITGYWQAPPGGGAGVSLDMDGNSPGSITTTNSFATSLGVTYDVTFYLAGNPDGPPTTKDLQVTVGGTVQDFTFDTTGDSRTNMGWTQESFSFIGTGSPMSLTFASLDTNTPYGPAVGDVSITAVPEPSILLFLGAGLIGLTAFRRRFKK
ncbi:MAG: choice-of-anchor C family protein [Syntrophorhabdales bacterium]|jgi:choice-of-anchor C domain-containing protein